MLREISIRNFAIIDDLRIEFSDGLTVLTGETGAGKSIVVNAVNLLLGGRATPQLIRAGADSAELEALFDVTPGSRTGTMLESCGYEASEGLIIRRIVSPDRSRIYINGKLATLQLLAQFTENLASISGQHAHQGLLKEENHLLILDRFGGLMPLRKEVARCCREILPLIENLRCLQEQQQNQETQRELYRFQKKEIEDAAFSPQEDAELERERARLKNSAYLYQTVHEAVETLYSAEGAVIEKLTGAGRGLEKAAEIDPALSKPAEALQSSAYELEEIAGSLRAYLNRLEMNDRRLDEVEARIDFLNRLKRKYGGSLAAVRSHLNGVIESLSRIESLPEQIAEIEKRLVECHERLSQAALRLSEERRQAAVLLSQKVEEELASLRMAQTRFQVSFERVAADSRTHPFLCTGGACLTESGIDRAVFLIAPNVGEPLKPLSGIASGGELSRVVLALKAISAETDSVETVIFDEVDAGIGGSVADVVGKKLSMLSKYHQVLCITHLPQIARFGDHHFQISKRVHRGRTLTEIYLLKKPERAEELARMLGGATVTDAARAHAREMLEDS
ncbi:MAG: DNA repair protein RecN [Desulfobacteraceae bacterium]|nr:MAG: DNA repair protein RecN [Desulfobacteraceae bacterium]